jgi:pimeloyl-ACP methyl ester carboxylesterase
MAGQSPGHFRLHSIGSEDLRETMPRLTRREACTLLTMFGASVVTGDAYSQTPARAPAWRTLPPTPTLPAPARSGMAAVNGTSVYYARFGEGPAVLLLHGGLANSNYWGLQIGELAKQFSVLVMDTRGHGRSPVMSQVFSYRAFADDVAGLLDFLNIASVAIVGWSDGGVTGLELAMRRPDRVNRLFAFGANMNPAGYKPTSSAVFAEFTRRAKTEYGRLSPHPERWVQLVGGLRGMWRTQPNFTPAMLRSIAVPILVLAAEHDEIIRRDHTEQMARLIPRARLVVQPDVSHFAMLQDPLGFNNTMIEFLRSKSGPAGHGVP